MAVRPSPTLLPLLAFLAALSVLFPYPARAELRVEAQLAAQEVRIGQPVELILTARSSEGSVAAPELSILEPDFEILDRRVERRMSVTNGKRREELRVRLVLLARRGGELEVPGIDFGGARTQRLRLRVEGEGQEPPDEIGRGPASPLLDPGVFEPPGVAMPAPFYPDYYTDWSSGLVPGAASPTPPLASSSLAPASPTLPPRGGQPAAPQASVDSPETDAGTLDNPWFWISLGLAILLAGVLGRRGRPSGALPVERSPGAPVETPPPDPLETAVETVRAAYQRGDGRGARDALLTWGRLRWPQDPPGNLARLAGRCPSPLRDHITQLEKAFFSPDPVHWERDPVPEELAAQSAARGRGAAAV